MYHADPLGVLQQQEQDIYKPYSSRLELRSQLYVRQGVGRYLLLHDIILLKLSRSARLC